MADEDEVDENSGNRRNLSNPSASTRSNGAGYLTSKGAKKGGGNTKKGVETAKSFDYLTSAAKKIFNYLQHAFTQTSILKHFDPKWYIRIKTNALGNAISRVLSQLTLDDLG